MSNIYQDEIWPDVVWMTFDGKTWDDFNTLVSDLAEQLPDFPEKFCLILDVQVEMPRGNPMPHMNRMSKLVSTNPQMEYVIAIVPKWFRIASTFASLAARITGNKSKGVIVGSVEDALKDYEAYCATKVI